MLRVISFVLMVFAIVGLIGCSSSTPTSLLVDTPTRVVSPTSIPTTIPTTLPTATSTVTATRAAVPPQVPTVASTRTPLPTLASTPTRTATVAAGTMKIKLFFVALNDNGVAGKKIGCGDSIVAVDRSIQATQAPLTAALKELLSIKDRNYGQSGLYNALAQANLNIDSVAIVDGKAIIQLSGTLSLGGVCDDPRVEAQLKEIALQFSTVKEVSITLNGIPLEKALSGKGN